MNPDQATGLARTLLAAREARRPISPLTDTVTLTMDDAYAVQRVVTQARLDRGERVVGWKLGYTSQAMRTQMGVDRPNYGPLTDAMAIPDGGSVPSALIHPRVEPEIAVILDRPLAGPVSRDEVRAAVRGAFASLEVVDSVFVDYRFRIEDNTADGSSAAGYVLGPLVASDGLDELAVVLEHNGAAVATATGAAASGHPLDGIAWLAERQPLAEGDLILTGGLTAAPWLAPGDTITATFGGRASVTVRRLKEEPHRCPSSR